MSAEEGTGNTVGEVVQTVEDFLGFGNETVYPAATLSTDQCHNQIDGNVDAFWNVLYAMVALLMATILMPYVFFCCKNYPRWLAKLYGLSGIINVVIGILMVSVLLPKCPLECGELFCSVHKYNPGPIYGCVMMFLGILWWCKACALRRQAKKEEIEKMADKAEAARGAKDGTSNVV